jgi:Zn-dependent protease with chaperone function
MPVLLLPVTLLLVVIGGYGVLGLLRRHRAWGVRRYLLLSVLAAPSVSLAVGSAGLYHAAAGRICFLGAPPWDYALGVIEPAVMGLVAAGALGLGVIRLGLMSWAITRRTVGAGSELHALADCLAERLGAPRPRLLLWASDRPLALTCGLRRPTVILSRWLVERLDAREMESVLAHELGHAARHDYLATWVDTVLRDAFFYVPTSWAAYRHFQAEKELACDDLAVSVTKRPLALAGALAKVWHQALGGPPPGPAQAFTEAGTSIEQRIERLIEGRASRSHTPFAPPQESGLAGIRAPALARLLAFQATAVIVMLLNPLSCGPG